ncbi:2'-5' RNA ligase family protein [Roseivirga misakiensis]|uniref:2'-5' RNA ligase n=1 Tax=Roseivirga misakiensis TaxID=1563681 RepID=A0A1E5SZK6_9BACT|nr:2'-5' RNA ligase family protein [Roseivirga misakiensis]OEK04539.1 hypothetical protein BFP71_13820 [Roseivirga misakiensis]
MILEKGHSLFNQSDLSEYLFIVLPYAEISKEVKSFKRDFFSKYGAYPGQNSCAHIRLVSFFQPEEREKRLLKASQEVLNQIKGFEIFLNGFGFYGVDRHIFLEVLNKQSLVDVYHLLRFRLFQELVSLSFLNKQFEPTLNIGTGFTALQFMDAVRDYEHEPYTNSFRVTRIHVLKRKAPFKTWENLTTLPLAKSEGELLGLL